MKMERGFNNIEGSGYTGPGFKFTPVEFKAEIDKFIDKGMTFNEATEAVRTKEKKVRESQTMTRQMGSYNRAA